MATKEQKQAIYRAYHGKVCGYIRSKIRNAQDAEDLAADVFVKVYEKLDTFDETRASLSTWIYTVTRNTLTDHFRTRRTFEEIPETLADGSSVEESVCSAETEARQAAELSDDDLALVAAAGEPAKRGTDDPVFDKEN